MTTPTPLLITTGICGRQNGVQGSVCAAAIQNRSCPLWVKSRHCGTSNQCPLYPQKRTLILSLCQKRTFMGAFAVNDSRRQTVRFFPAVFSRERASDQVLRRIRQQ